MGYIQWLRERVGHAPLNLNGSVTVVRDASGAVLLQHRSDGRWGLPGGLMELGESCEETARRELWEETGVEADELRLLGVYSGRQYFCRVKNGDEFYCVTAAYEAVRWHGEPRVHDGESTALGWYRPDALPENMVKSHLQILKEHLGEKQL